MNPATEPRTDIGNRLLVLTAGGAAGGFAGFVISEISGIASRAPDPGITDNDLRIQTGFWFLLVIVGIGAGIVGSNSFLNRALPPPEVLALTVPALLVGGFVSGYVAQYVFESLLGEGGTTSGYRAARIIGWSIAGLLGGLAVTVGSRSPKRIQNGLLGGLGGGFLGGLLFDPVAEIVQAAGPSRFIGIVLIGTLMGVLIGLIDAARTYMWIEILTGEFRGRSYPVIDDPARVGSARTLEVPIGADRSIAEVHLVISRSSGDTFTCSAGQTVLHNGVPATSGRIGHGDVMRIGSTDVRFGLKNQSTMTTAPTAPPVADQSHRQTATYVDRRGPATTDPSPRQPAPPTVQPPSAPKERPRVQVKKP